MTNKVLEPAAPANTVWRYTFSGNFYAVLVNDQDEVSPHYFNAVHGWVPCQITGEAVLAAYIKHLRSQMHDILKGY